MNEQPFHWNRRTGLGAIDSERFDAMAAVGGWRGILESVVPTLMFVLVMAVRPAALVAALIASLAISAICFVARLVQRQSPAQVVGGARAGPRLGPVGLAQRRRLQLLRHRPHD